MQNNSISVMLADDHPLIRAGLRTTLEAASDICLIGETENGYDLREMVQKQQPDVLLLDLSMPGPPVAETVAWLVRHYPRLRVLILTAYDDDAYVRTAVSAGAAGYALKDEPPEVVLRAIRAVQAGDVWFSQRIISKVLKTNCCEDSSSAEIFLSERDKEVLHGLALGWDNSQLAAEMHVAEQTARNYVSRLYSALGIRTRTEAAIWAREHGFG